VNETQVRVWKPHRASFVFQVLSFKLGSLCCVFAKPQAQLVLLSALNPSAPLHLVTHFQIKRSNWRFIVGLLKRMVITILLIANCFSIRLLKIVNHLHLYIII
jgi:hypothetical protein